MLAIMLKLKWGEILSIPRVWKTVSKSTALELCKWSGGHHLIGQARSWGSHGGRKNWDTEVCHPSLETYRIISLAKMISSPREQGQTLPNSKQSQQLAQSPRVCVTMMSPCLFPAWEIRAHWGLINCQPQTAKWQCILTYSSDHQELPI